MDEMTKTVVTGEVGSVEVLFAWRDATGQRAVIDAELVDAERCPAVWIGAHQGLRFVLPMELASRLGEGERFRLVGIDHGRFVLQVPEAAELVATKGGQPLEVQGVERVRSLELALDHVAEIRFGEFSFFVRPGAAPEKAADRGPLLDWRAARWGLAAFAAHAVFVGSFFFAPPNAAALNMDLDPSAQRYVQVSLAAIAHERELLQLPQGGGSSGNGATEPDEAAGAGNDTPEVHIAGGPGQRSGSARRSEHALQVTAENIAQMGTIASLSSALATITGDSSVYGNPDMIDGPGGPGFEHLVGGPGIGGWGGLDMRDGGRGTCLGEHCGQGTLAVGQLHTTGPIGPGGVGIGDPNGGRPPGRVPNPIRPGTAETNGGLSREQVQRTVRQHINEVRFCYSQELQSRPDLEGRVAVRFMVNAEGRVMSSLVAQESGQIGDVGQCVSESVRRWTFPASSGPTSVTYPFVLQSAQ
ncbi:MAG: AgmX/PglI C-terminal domain-containing protein [Sandaracinaceae bacterium]|nr:AgmX/PglI C-terminal domain-containing protein [Sandaracinaceae bacterium]